MGIFSYESKFFQTINQVIDCIVLSLMWIFSSLPIITVGASTTALYHTVHKAIGRGEGKIWNEYWRAFRRDFKQATGLWLLMVLILGVLAVNWYAVVGLTAVTETIKTVLEILVVFLSAFMAIWLQFWFPYLARFSDSTKTVLKNTMAIMTSETKCAVWLLGLLVMVAAVDGVLSVYVPVLTLLMPVAYMISLNRILERVFVLYMDSRTPEQTVERKVSTNTEEK